MEEIEAAQTCRTCHREVAEANIALHESHCARFLSVCPDCSEAVPKEQLEQHREEQHAQVKCSKCTKKMERCLLADHEAEECPERLQACPFCELEVRCRELDAHCVVCGSRTELCKECGRYVQLREQQEHSSTCGAPVELPGPAAPSSGASDQSVLVNCRMCRGPFLLDDIDQHECFAEAQFDSEEEEPQKEDKEEALFSAQLSSTYKSGVSVPLVSQEPPGSEVDRISTCPHCHLALPVPTLQWHQGKCQVHIFLKNTEV